MSPEQTAGSRELDGRSDVYSLGCVLYEMLAGQPPFTGPTAQSLAHQHLNIAPRPVTDLRPAVPGELERTIQRTLSKTAADRFRTAAEFVQALADAPAAPASGAGLARAASGETRPGDAGSSAHTAPMGTRSAESPTPVSAAETVPTPASDSVRSRRLRRLALSAAVVVAVGVGLWKLVPGPQPAPPTERLAIAVLPFQNLSAQSEHAYFAGGLHDELLTQLAKVGTLKVISRTSVMGYQGTSKRLKEIARELGVGSLVEGSVQVVGERLRVNVQLIDAATDEHLWAESYDRRLDDAFAIQSDVAQQVAHAVGAALSSAEQGRLAARPTANAEAYRLYLQGSEYFGRPGLQREDREAAQRLYEQALALDPEFALAYAALSLVHGQMHFARYDLSPGRLELQREAAETALRLAPELPQAHVAMGQVHYQVRRDYRRALDELAIALRGLPNDADLWRLIGSTNRRLGNWDGTIAALEKVTQLDPRHAGLHFTLGGPTYVLLHRYEEAVREYDRALSLAPDLHEAALQRAWTYVSWQGQLDTLRVALSHIPVTANLAFTSVAAARSALALWQRDAASVLRANADLDGNDLRLDDVQTRGLYVAWAHQLRGDHAAARAAFDSARVRLNAELVKFPDDWRLHSARGMALAGLGSRGEARAEAQWLQQSVVYREDHFDGPRAAEDRARILAQIGDAEAALDEITRLLAEPSWLSAHRLRLDPRWDPIRGHPRFKELVARYSRS
jgi:serine/threonine-protein kinase